MGGNRRTTSIHRHLASVGAAITGVIGGLFLQTPIPLAVNSWISHSSRDYRFPRAGTSRRPSHSRFILTCMDRSRLKNFTSA